MSGRPWLEALKATMRERDPDTEETLEKISEALRLEGCESPADEPTPDVDIQTAKKVRGSWREEERRLIVAGWKPKERGGFLIWANPKTGFYFSQEIALHRLEAREAGKVGTFPTQKKRARHGLWESCFGRKERMPLNSSIFCTLMHARHGLWPGVPT